MLSALLAPTITALQETLEAAIRLLGADKGNVQLWDDHPGVLRIVGHHGFTSQFLRHFETVTPGYCACGLSIRERRRVVVEDVFLDDRFRHLAPIFSSYGFVSVNSTPIYHRDGRLLGVLSTHHARPQTFRRDRFGALDRLIETRLSTVEPPAPMVVPLAVDPLTSS